MTRTVFCHGVWDGLHIGHIQHLAAARGGYGDRLVVGVTGDHFVGKGPGRPRYDAAQRVATVRSLKWVDSAVVIEASDPSDWIRENRPEVYAKGKEYEGRDCPDFRAAREVGCEVVFIGDTLGSSSAALNAEAELDPFIADCRKRYSAKDVDEAFAKIAQAGVYVIGDGIEDVYVPCELVGMTSKGGAPSVRLTGATETQYGGAWALRNHTLALGALIRGTYAPHSCTKHRHFSMAGQQIRVHFAAERVFAGLVPPYGLGEPGDLLLVADFGHGAITPELLTAINQHGRAAVTCQTNSLNIGLNVLTKRYRDVGLFVVDDRELKLACHKAEPTKDDLRRLAFAALAAERGYWTRGERNTVATSGHSCPALESHPIDPLGAGDAFFTVAALCWHAGLPDDLSLLLAQIAGAQMTRVLGNSRSLDKDAMMRTAKAILA